MKPGTVLITGASGGIGAATALHFGSKGWNVAAGYCRSARDALETVSAINKSWPHACAFRADVTDFDDSRSMVRDVIERFGQIDLLVNNAGVEWYGLFQDMTPAEMKRIMDVNVMGTAYCTQAVLPDMLRRKQGVIVNVSSVWGVCGGSCEAMYSASKAAVIGLTKALAQELGPSGIRVNCVAPGPVRTKMLDRFSEEDLHGIRSDTALGYIGGPEEVAEAVWFLGTDKSRYITGEVLNINGGMAM